MLTKVYRHSRRVPLNYLNSALPGPKAEKAENKTSEHSFQKYQAEKSINSIKNGRRK